MSEQAVQSSTNKASYSVPFCYNHISTIEHAEEMFSIVWEDSTK